LLYFLLYDVDVQAAGQLGQTRAGIAALHLLSRLRPEAQYRWGLPALPRV